MGPEGGVGIELLFMVRIRARVRARAGNVVMCGCDNPQVAGRRWWLSPVQCDVSSWNIITRRMGGWCWSGRAAATVRLEAAMGG